MDQITCPQHHGIHAAARTRVNANVRSSLAITTMWFATKPYGGQRSSGAPPG